MSNVVKDCVADSQEYLNHIVATCGARLVERIAEDYGLSDAVHRAYIGAEVFVYLLVAGDDLCESIGDCVADPMA